MNKLTGFALFIFGAGIGVVATWYGVKAKYEQLAQEDIDSVKEFCAKKDHEHLLNTMAERGATKKELDTVVALIKKYKEPDKAPDEEKVSRIGDKPEIAELTKKVRENGYTNYSNIDGLENDDGRPRKRGSKKAVKKPYVISPEEFGEVDGYNKISLTYYADRVLADDGDELVKDIDDVVGVDSLTTFGQYEDDSVFVRNDRLKCDYEILLDQRTYSDVAKMRPPNQMEG